MGSGKKRGWIIIGMDLLIVLGIYFLYSQFAFDSATVNTTSFQADFSYTVSVNQPTGETIPLTVSMTNNRNKPVKSRFPSGVLLLLTNGRDKKYWSTRLVGPTALTLNPGETRSWSLPARRPDNYRGPLYLELFIDTNRQDRVKVPSP